MCVNTAQELFYKTRSTSGSIPVNIAEELFCKTRSTSRSIPVNIAEELFCKTRSTSRSIPVNIAEELFCKTRSTSRSISTLLGVVIMQRSSSTEQGVPVVVYVACCVYKYCRGALLHDRERQQEYIYPVIYKTRSTSGISILLCLLILQRSSSTRQGAPVGVYLPCCVC